MKKMQQIERQITTIKTIMKHINRSHREKLEEKNKLKIKNKLLVLPGRRLVSHFLPNKTLSDY